MGENKYKKDSNNYDYYWFSILTGLGISFGVIFDQLAIGICLGVSLGLALDFALNKKNK